MQISLQIIMFGDLNIGKEELFAKYGERIKKLGGEILISKNVNSFTRTNKGVPFDSYIDYFIVFNI